MAARIPTFALVVLTAGGGVALAGCGSQAAANQELRVPVASAPVTLDPTQELYSFEGAVGRNVFEGLTRVKPDLSDVEGAAASSWTVSADGLTWTFKIRSDERFSDGTAVTASDFVYSYKRILDPTVASGNADPYYDQKIAGAQDYPNVNPKDAGAVARFLDGLGLAAPDPGTFVVRLQHPAPYFKWMTSLFIAAPLKKSEVDAMGSDKFGSVSAQAPAEIIGNGPFKISELVPNDHITLVPNPYYRPRPTLQKLVIRWMSPDAAYLAYQNGELDLTAVPLADTAVARGAKGFVSVPALEIYWLQFNTTVAPFDNVNLRRAFAEAIDRGTYARYVLDGRGIPATTLIPKGMGGYRPDLGAPLDFSPANAKAALAASGVTADRLNAMKLTYIFTGTSSNKTIAEYLQSQWQTTLGVNVALIGLDNRSRSARRNSGNFTIEGLEGWLADYPDPQDFYDNFATGATAHFGGYSDPAYDSIVAQADSTPDGPSRDNAYASAQAILTSDAPIIFLDQPESWWLVKPYVTNLVHTPIDDFIGDFYDASIQIVQH